MADIELTRMPGARRLYALEGVGTLRLQGFASRRASAEAAGTSWRIARRAFWQRLIEATDAAGTAVVTRAQAEYEVVLDPETYEKLEVRR